MAGGEVDALGKMRELLDHLVAMGEVGGRRTRNAVDLRADLGDAVLHAGDDALDLRGATAGILGAQRGLAAFADEAADLAVEPAHGVADLHGGLPRGFGQALHFAGDHGKALARSAGARGFDGGIQRQQIGLFRDRLD